MQTQKSSQTKTPSIGRTVTAAASQPPREVDDAISFLHSMLSLIEVRGWNDVEEQFALAMTGMADKILGPSSESIVGEPTGKAKAIDDARRAIDAAAQLLEDLPLPRDRVPTWILKGAVMMIEATVRSARGEQVEIAARFSADQRSPGGLS